MYKIKDIVIARKEVLDGTFQGVIQTHKVDAKEKRLENDPEEFLKITYPSSAIKRILERIDEKLSGKSDQGGFLLVGPYGSGKSHTLKSRSVIVSTRRYDVDHLWVPIFRLLGREDLLSEVKRFPTTDQIEEMIGNDTVAIFIDEIENWYGAFDPEKQAHLIEQNETFLEHLLEVAADPTKKLFVFITFLEEYINAYSEPIEIDDIHNYKRRMIRTYPFHPLLLDTLFQIYGWKTRCKGNAKCSC
ncbi:MAG: hypothetical protein N2V76_08630 [Methanophagales archaeon]|nr:hypothetical protein [Methanophagales archaeon]